MKKNKQKKYRIELTENQLFVLEEALEILSRLGIKQYATVLEHVETKDKMGLSWDDRQDIQTIIRNIEKLDMPQNASYGIYSPEINDKYRVAWDMIKVFRFVRSWANAEDKPEDRRDNFVKYMGVNYDNPMKSSKEPLAKCKEIK